MEATTALATQALFNSLSLLIGQLQSGNAGSGLSQDSSYGVRAYCLSITALAY